METDLIYRKESFQISGKCREVRRELGHGFLEVVYKDALEIVFKQHNIFMKEERSTMFILGIYYCRIGFMQISS